LTRLARKRSAWLGAFAGAALVLPMIAGSTIVAAARHHRAASGGTLIFAQQTEPDSLDNAHTILGASWTIFSEIYDTLVVEPKPGQFAGEIAKSWTISKNGLVYTFQIRKGLKFSNGDPLTAQAVAFTFNRILNPATKSPDLGVIGPIQSVKAVGNYTAVFTLKQPFAYELADLAVGYAGIEDPAAVQKEGAKFGRDPVGSGPFMLKSWVSGESITLVPNPYYHSYAPYDKNHGPAKETVKYLFISNQESQVAAMQSGEANILLGLPGQNYAQFKSNPQFSTLVYPAQDINYLEFKYSAPKGGTPQILPPFNDVRVRQAAGYAMDPAGQLKSAAYGLGTVEYGVIPVGTDAYDPALKSVGFHYDPALAEKLLTEAGWKPGAGGVRYKDGKPLDVTLWVFTLGYYPQLAQIMANELDAVGFKVNIQALAIASLLAEFPKGNVNMDVVGLGWPNSSIMNVEYTLPLGSGNFPDPYLENLLNKAEATTNNAQRIKLYDEAQAYQLKKAYAIPMFSDNNVILMAKSVHGFVLTANNSYDLVNVTVGG
jgi:peptide/nickel transport system substrate-binding protein